MKNKLTAILGLLILILAQACKKGTEYPSKPNEKSKMELIMAGKWQIKAIIVDPPMVISGKTITNFYDGYSECEKDGFELYKADSIIVYDEGPLKCNSSTPQTRNSKWYFTSDYSMIIEGGSTKMLLRELTDSTLVKQYLDKIDDITYTYTFKYKNIN